MIGDGRMVSQYRILRKIGQGGMGEVYLAEDTLLKRPVALKFLSPEMQKESTAQKRLLREARSAAALDHPFICHINEIGEVDGLPYIAMEYVEGQTLKERLSKGAMPLPEALQVTREVAEALTAAHAKGIIHRDIKPANIMLTQSGHAKVMDFGLAKAVLPSSEERGEDETLTELTQRGMAVGTLAYMSPEQLRGTPASAQSDLWALGVTLFEMISGSRPFQGQSGFELSSSILHDPPRTLPAGTSSAVQEIIGRCLEKDLPKRFQQADEVGQALERIQSGAGEVPPAQFPRLRNGPRFVRVAGGLALLALAGVLLAGFYLGGWPDRLLGFLAQPRLHSLAVLPIANLSGDAEQEYFADGMTEALITYLSKISALRVISRRSVMQFKGTRQTLPEIARTLNVEAILAGSVVREASRVRVTAQLIEAKTERPLWAESYEHELTSILALQSQIARSVAGIIRVKLTPEEDGHLGRTRTVNPSTYEAYLKGMSLLNKGTPAEIKKGLGYFHEAVEKDPADPQAYAGLALAYVELAHGAEAREDSLVRARAAAMTALRLDSTVAEAFAAKAMVEGYFKWNWEEAFRDFDRALTLNPSLSIAYYHRAWFHILFGRLDQGEEDQKRALELNPLDYVQVSHLALLYSWQRRWDDATVEAQKAIEMAPRFPLGYAFLAEIYRGKGMLPEALQTAQQAGELSRAWYWAIGPIFSAAGRKEEARQLLDELNRQKPSPWLAFWQVHACAASGNIEDAFRWLAYRPHHAWLPWIRVWPNLETLQRDPRFSAALQKMNLPPIKEPPSGAP